MPRTGVEESRTTVRPFAAALSPRLAALLDTTSPDCARLRLLIAPAGFGKTALMSCSAAALRRDGGRAVWLTCSADHHAAPELLRTIQARLADLDRSPADAAAPRVLFIDEYERAGGAENDRALLDLALDLPPGRSIVVASRRRPALPLARAVVNGDVQLIEGDDLCLRPAESQALLAGCTLSVEMEAIVAAAAGWPAILTLVRLSCARRVEEGASRLAIGALRRRIHDYIVGEVLAPLDTALREFLLDTAVLEKIGADAANAIRSARDSHEHLQALETLAPLATFTAQPFVARLHPMVAHALRAELERTDPQRLKRLHLCAAEYHAGRSRVYEAVAHALNAKDIAHAVQMIERSGPLGLQVSEGPRGVRNLLDLLPQGVVSHNIRLRITRVVQLAMEENVVEAKLEHERLEQEIEARQNLPEIARLELEIARCVTQVYESEHSLDAPVWPSIAHAAERARRWVLDDPRLLVIPCAIELLFLLRTGRISVAENRVNELDQLFRRLRRERDPEWNWAYRSVVHLGRLEFDAAEALLLRALRVAEDTFGDERSPLADFTHACLAKVYFHRNLIDKALAHIVALGDVPSWNVIEVLEALHVLRARCHIAQGRCSEALEVLRAGRAIATARALCHLRLICGATEIELLARLGWPAQASSLAAEIDLSGFWELALTSQTLPLVDVEAAAKALFALAVTRQDAAAAALIADQYAARVRGTGLLLAEITAALLKTRASQLLGQTVLARETLRNAIISMRGLDGLRLLLDAGPELVPTLRAIVDQRDEVAAQWASAVMAALEGDVRSWMSADPLFTAREQDVFAGLLRAASTKEIARQLELSPETVKTHLKAIFGKLRVRDRNEAVAEAWRRVLRKQTTTAAPSQPSCAQEPAADSSA